MAIVDLKLPDLGEGVTEGEIVKWLVKPGDTIAEDDGVVEVMTDKATVTIPSQYQGKVLEVKGEVGEIKKIHELLIRVETGVASTAAAAPAPTAAAPASTAATPALTAGTQLPAVAQMGSISPFPMAAAATREKVTATPLTRRMAQVHNIDLSEVVGSGPKGRVLKVDLEAFLGTNQESAAPAPAPTRSPVTERIPIRGLRKRIAEKMVKSKFTAPHYTFVEEVDATQLVALRERFNALRAGESGKISYLPFIVKAAVAAFRKYPRVNATMDEAAQELVVHASPNIGIAVMTPGGLTVPVIKGAERRSLQEISKEVERLAKAAREQRCSLDELTGGTFTISSLGSTGGLMATPIINHPEVAIMGVHRLAKRPAVGPGDTLIVKPMMNLSFSFDHRVIDGAVGAEFAYELIRYLENPELLWLEGI